MIIAQYFPLLLKKEWWLGYKDPTTNNISLLDDNTPESYKSLVIAEIDVEATKDKL